MDLSFTRRRKGAPNAGTPDLQSLLSAAAARQSSSPTAKAAGPTDHSPRNTTTEDPRIDMFAAESESRPHPNGGSSSASFSKIPGKSVGVRK
jgi:hypothetical protein